MSGNWPQDSSALDRSAAVIENVYIYIYNKLRGP
jgi:hypothetical protein